jgi:hypothetical protein
MAGEWFLTDLETARAAVESAIVEVESPGGDASQPEEALWAAINRAGGARALARELGIAHQAISKWERVPPLRVLEVERISGISRYQLRPDIYGEKPR